MSGRRAVGNWVQQTANTSACWLASSRKGRSADHPLRAGECLGHLSVKRVQNTCIVVGRPKLTAPGDPDHDHVVAGIVARLIELPRRAEVLAEDETRLNLPPMWGRAGRCAACARRCRLRGRTGRSRCWA